MHNCILNASRTSLLHYTSMHSINAVGVDIAPFSAMSDEEEVLLLPGLPLVNLAGENPEEDLWTFEIETPRASASANPDGAPPVMIDYVHPGDLSLMSRQSLCAMCAVFLAIGC